MTIDLWTLPKKKKIEKDDEEETEEEEQSSLERMADRRPTRTSSSVVETPTRRDRRDRPARFLQLVAAAGFKQMCHHPCWPRPLGRTLQLAE